MELTKKQWLLMISAAGVNLAAEQPDREIDLQTKMLIGQYATGTTEERLEMLEMVKANIDQMLSDLLPLNEVIFAEILQLKAVH